MRILSYIGIVVLISLFASCEKTSDSPLIPASGPFSNGGSERNMIVVISDLHLGADIAYTECNKNLPMLERTLQQIRVASNVKELVLDGDVLDEWFVPASVNTYEGKDQSDFVQRIATLNPGVFTVINQIIQEKKITVTYVPGNHDLNITAENVNLVLPGINQARDTRGLGTYTPASLSILAIEHGHCYNFACAPDPISNRAIAPGSIMPFGYFFTRIAVLCVQQKFPAAGDSIVKVTVSPSANESQKLAYEYWQGWTSLMKFFPITNKFSEKIIVTNINGFTQTYAVDDITPYQTTPEGFIDMTLFKDVQDTWEARQDSNLVPIHIPTAQAIAQQNDNGKTDDQAKVQYFMNPNSNIRLVVFGHTHIAKIIPSTNHNGLKSIYANSGTWIDSNTAPLTMNFVVITPQSSVANSQTYVKLYNIENEAIKTMAVDSLPHY